MDVKAAGTWLVVFGILILVVYPMYKAFTENDMPIFIKAGLVLLFLGILLILLKLYLEKGKMPKEKDIEYKA
ncbi:MAG: hypothetical protein B6U68_03770 [Candidatus Aenigmarchaeota archaeon ex4484_14]|nr:MAG: hypothetical protein B6U68_03770 [Candidatus Aenigmarchaeota archaeon ex4484_14]